MDRADLQELQCIQPVGTLRSIADLGILCHNLAEGLDHEDVADGTIQDRRHGKAIPHSSSKGRELHDYANVYICARNPMMYVRRHLHTRLAVLRVAVDLLDVEGAIVVDGNASSDYSRFMSSPDGLTAIDEKITFLGDPTHPDRFEFYRRKRVQCAEVLVPERIPPEYVTGGYVSSVESLVQVEALELPWQTTICPRTFFQSDE